MFAFAGPETITIVLLVALVVFGGSKIPDLARSLGKAKGEFHKGLAEGDEAKSAAANQTAAPQAPVPPQAPAAPQAPAPPPVSEAAPAPAPQPAAGEAQSTPQS